MGMPCEINSILKLKVSQGYPEELKIASKHQALKEGYRIIPIDVPLPLVDDNWIAHADVIIRKLIWEKNQTVVFFEIDRVYEQAFKVKA